MNQAIAIIQRYQTQALSDLGLKIGEIEEFHKGPKMRTAFPWVTVAYEGTAFTEASQQTREQHVSLVITLESGNFDSELAQDQAIDYLRMLDYIFNVLTGNPDFRDWESKLPIIHETVTSGQTTPWAVGTVKQVFVEREEQSLVVRQGLDQPIMEVSLHIRLDLEELNA